MQVEDPRILDECCLPRLSAKVLLNQENMRYVVGLILPD
ncbi:hypothetical protein FHX11_006010 [Rhizobium sp. BK602]|nr:hypothetical protein [Rhizobium sp. BK602]